VVQRPHMDRSSWLQSDILLKRCHLLKSTGVSLLHACGVVQSTWQTWWMGTSCTTALLGALCPKFQTWISEIELELQPLIRVLDIAGMQ
jgi:hypothetical protein